MNYNVLRQPISSTTATVHRHLVDLWQWKEKQSLDEQEDDEHEFKMPRINVEELIDLIAVKT